MPGSIDDARAVQRRLAKKYANTPQINGIGITRSGDGFAVKINLTEPLTDAKIPSHVGNVDVRVDVVGPVVAY
jgi:hypothetical protein